MNPKIKELTLTSMFLAMAGILSIIQIPLFGTGVSLDIAFVAILIGRRYVGFWKMLVVSFVYPFFSLLGPTGSMPGVLFLILQCTFILTLDFLLCKDKYSFVAILFVIFSTTIFSTLINALLIAPMFMGDMNDYYNNFWENAIPWIIIAILFNPFKLTIVYLIVIAIWKKLVKLKLNN